MAITRENLQQRNIADNVSKILKEFDIASQKEMTMKINFLGQNTGYEVMISKAFFKDKVAKMHFIERAEEQLNREIDFGERHICVGTKLIWL